MSEWTLLHAPEELETYHKINYLFIADDYVEPHDAKSLFIFQRSRRLAVRLHGHWHAPSVLDVPRTHSTIIICIVRWAYVWVSWAHRVMCILVQFHFTVKDHSEYLFNGWQSVGKRSSLFGPLFHSMVARLSVCVFNLLHIYSFFWLSSSSLIERN